MRENSTFFTVQIDCILDIVLLPTYYPSLGHSKVFRLMHNYQITTVGQPLEKAPKALIILHDRGETAADAINLALKLCDETFYIAAPQASNNSWYPENFMAEDKLNEPWLSSAIEVVIRLINETAKQIPKDHIYVAGFSQGACLALEALAKHPDRYGGIVAFTGGLIGKSIIDKKYRGNFRGTKVLIGNSDRDPLAPLERSQETKKVMEMLGADVTLKVYPWMEHLINENEIGCARQVII